MLIHRIQIEKEELNGIKEASDVEYDILKQKYNDSLHQIDKLKKDMFEKENNIETEKKYQIELKNKIKTATYEQHNLNTEIKALKILLRERDEKLELKSNEIYKVCIEFLHLIFSGKIPRHYFGINIFKFVLFTNPHFLIAQLGSN